MSLFYQKRLVVVATVAFFVFSIGIFSSTAMQAGPAAPNYQEITLEDGQTINVRQVGDENRNFIIDEDNKIVESNHNYMSNFLHSNSGNLSVFNSSDEAELNRGDWSRISGEKRFESIQSRFLPIKEPKSQQDLLVVLVNFEDTQINYSQDVWSNKFFGSDESSVNSYYDEVSNGRLEFVPAQESYGQENDGVIAVNLDFPHPNPGAQFDDSNYIIVAQALKEASEYIDFSQYDRNGDGYLQTDELHIVTVIAGYDAIVGFDNSPSIWSHYSGFAGLELDGVSVANHLAGGGYVQVGELFYGETKATLATLVHELGHSLGLPDLYDTTGSTAGLGMFSMMADGMWGTKSGGVFGDSPVHLDAWSKYMLGFVEPTVVEEGTYKLNSHATGNYNVLKIKAGEPENSTEYFLLENRQFQGFDKGLKGDVEEGGVAIYHIDESSASPVFNDDKNKRLVSLQEADKQELGYSPLDSNSFSNNSLYYVGNQTLFDGFSKPNSNLNNANPSGVEIEIKSVSGDVMEVEVRRVSVNSTNSVQDEENTQVDAQRAAGVRNFVTSDLMQDSTDDENVLGAKLGESAEGDDLFRDPLGSIGDEEKKVEHEDLDKDDAIFGDDVDGENVEGKSEDDINGEKVEKELDDDVTDVTDEKQDEKPDKDTGNWFTQLFRRVFNVFSR